jgi:alkylation response protein AidB-like acyl-CoA dehydrogenase
MFPIRSPGVEVQRIEMLNGLKEFSQEFMTDLRVPDDHRIGGVDHGWTVGSRWMFYERMGRNSPLVTAPEGEAAGSGAGMTMQAIARAAGKLEDSRARELIGEAHTLQLVDEALRRRIGQGIVTRTLSDQSSAIARLFIGLAEVRRATIAFELAGAAAANWTEDDGDLLEWGTDFLIRQAACIGGGTTEIAANVISERLLKMPREEMLDRDRPFRDVPRSPSGRSTT